MSAGEARFFAQVNTGTTVPSSSSTGKEVLIGIIAALVGVAVGGMMSQLGGIDINHCVLGGLGGFLAVEGFAHKEKICKAVKRFFSVNTLDLPVRDIPKRKKGEEAYVVLPPPHVQIEPRPLQGGGG
jgi:hypothetical protein